MSINYETILTVLSIGTIVFGAYSYFKNPQDALDKKQAIDQVEIDNKAGILAADLTSEKHATERRFREMGERMDRGLTLAENHTHTVDTKVDILITSINGMNLQLTNAVTELRTIINERIPKK